MKRNSETSSCFYFACFSNTDLDDLNTFMPDAFEIKDTHEAFKKVSWEFRNSSTTLTTFSYWNTTREMVFCKLEISFFDLVHCLTTVFPQFWRILKFLSFFKICEKYSYCDVIRSMYLIFKQEMTEQWRKGKWKGHFSHLNVTWLTDDPWLHQSNLFFTCKSLQFIVAIWL